jgi:hypothetical protein
MASWISFKTIKMVHHHQSISVNSYNSVTKLVLKIPKGVVNQHFPTLMSHSHVLMICLKKTNLREWNKLDTFSSFGANMCSRPRLVFPINGKTLRLHPIYLPNFGQRFYQSLPPNRLQ